jgi:hypothetical protein
MATNIGLNIVEVDGAAAPAIVGAATSVGAFNIITRRGVPNRAVPITSFPKFVERFGGYFAGGLGAYLVKGFFDNGGLTAYVNRVVATDSTTGAKAAELTLLDAANRDTLLVQAAFRGALDPGAWGNDLYVSVGVTTTPAVRLNETLAATIKGTAWGAPTVDMAAASFPALNVKVDNEANATSITFTAIDFLTPTAATQAEVAAAINRRTGKIFASVGTGGDANKLIIKSTGEAAKLSGGFTKLEVTGANATLGFAVATVTGTPAPLNAGGTQVARIDELHVGDAVKIQSGGTSALVKLLSVNQVTNDVTWTPNITPGGFDPLLTRLSRVEADLKVAQGGTADDNVVETWTGLSMESDVANYAPKRINDALQGSRYITVTDKLSSSVPGADVPVAGGGFARMGSGRDGTAAANDFIGDSANRTGFFAFDPYDVQLIACERTDGSILTAALAYCANRGDCMVIGSVPEGYVEGGQAVAFGQAFQSKKSYGALYGPWIGVTDPIGSGGAPIKRIPPVGHVMGVFARIETARGIWKAPAGDEANLLGAIDVEYRLSDGEHTDLVRNGSVNGIRPMPRSGIVIDASRTLSTDTRWLYVNVRLLFNYVKSSLKVGLRWVRQEPNRDTLWASVKFTSVIPFLMGLWRQGAFGTGAPAEVFTVICDANNNPPDEVDKGNLKVEVYFYPSKPAETIVIVVGQQASGAKVSEA